MAVVPTTTYLYVDTTLTQFFVQGTELSDQGPWSSSATYAINNVVQIGSDQYIALAVNTNAPPTGIVDENWSLLVVVEENTVIPSAGSDGVARALAEAAFDLAGSAYDLAGTAYFWGTSAYDLAGTAIDMVVAETGSRIAADAAIVAFVFGSIAVDLAAETGSRIAADITEAGTRSDADQYLQTQIIVEQGTRAQEDQVLATAIVDEAGSREAADAAIVAFVFGSIAVDLAAETGSRIAADLTEAGTRSQADQFLATAIIDETGSRVAADAAIVAFVFGSIAVDLAAETGSRIAADITEAGTRSQEDQNLQTQIFVEQGTRAQEDQDLQNQIIVEQGTRAQEDQNLQTQIIVEQGTRAQQDQFLYNLIIATGGSSFGSFVDLSGSLAAETAARIAADSAEAGTRSQEDQFLQNQITSEIATRAAADSQISAIAAIGTNTGTAAYQLAVEALGIAQAGTNANGKVIMLCAAYTPLIAGYDNAEVPVPYYAQDGTTVVNWTTRRLNVRVQVAGSASVVAFEKSTGTGAFTAIGIGTVTLPDSTYEASATNTGTGVNSGDKLRFNVLTLGSSQNWTCTVELSSP